MALSRLEIQQMLREMNVKFQADETLEELKQRLQQENHRLWLQSVSDGRTAAGGIEKKVVRKRKQVAPPSERITDSPRASVKPETSAKPAKRAVAGYSRRPQTSYQPQPIEKPAPGKPWKAVADGTEPFNRKKNVFDSVLRRAGMCCERCGIKSAEGEGTVALNPYHILPLSQGGEHSIKNVVALCQACLKDMQDNPDTQTIKDLKRRTRLKLYGSLQVVRKKTMRTQRLFSRRRK